MTPARRQSKKVSRKDAKIAKGRAMLLSSLAHFSSLRSWQLGERQKGAGHLAKTRRSPREELCCCPRWLISLLCALGSLARSRKEQDISPRREDRQGKSYAAVFVGPFLFFALFASWRETGGNWGQAPIKEMH